MIITCERCATRFTLPDERVPASGAPVQCSQCGHVFMARRTGQGVPQLIVRCEQCATHFALEASLIPPSGALVQCSRCQHTFLFGGPPIPGVVPAAAPPPAAPGPLPRRDVMMFGGGLPDPTSPPAEIYRSAEGRMVFGAPLPGSANPHQPTSSLVIPAERQPRPPRPPEDELDQLFARAADSPEDEQLLLVLSDGLMERGDARGRLMAFMLEEEKGTELMRKVKINVLIRDNQQQWAPPGATITRIHRGLPVELEWHGQTEAEHLAWHCARSINVTLEQPPAVSVFDVERPNLRELTGLSERMLNHVLSLPPKQLRELSAHIRRDRLGELARALPRLPQLETLTLRTTTQVVDERLTLDQLSDLLPAAAKLKRLRICLPRVPFSQLDRMHRQLAPELDLQFIVPLLRIREPTVTMFLDLRRRGLLVPDGAVKVQAELLARDLSEFLGDRLALFDSW